MSEEGKGDVGRRTSSNRRSLSEISPWVDEDGCSSCSPSLMGSEELKGKE